MPKLSTNVVSSSFRKTAHQDVKRSKNFVLLNSTVKARISSKGFHPPSFAGEVIRGWNRGGFGKT